MGALGPSALSEVAVLARLVLLRLSSWTRMYLLSYSFCLLYVLDVCPRALVAELGCLTIAREAGA